MGHGSFTHWLFTQTKTKEIEVKLMTKAGQNFRVNEWKWSVICVACSSQVQFCTGHCHGEDKGSAMLDNHRLSHIFCETDIITNLAVAIKCNDVKFNVGLFLASAVQVPYCLRGL